MNSTLVVNEDIARKVLDAVTPGLSSGLGEQIPGQMCIEAAVCFAYGLPHSDTPPCVGTAVRSYKIRLNDARWSSKHARADGMKAIAIAQLGSVELDQKDFARRIMLKTMQTIISNIAAKYLPEVEDDLRKVEDIEAGAVLCRKVRAAASAAASAADSASASASDSAADSASASAAYAADAAAAYAADAAAAAAYAAYAAAYAAAAAAAKNRDAVLRTGADNCLQVLKDMNSPGCKFLYLLSS